MRRETPTPDLRVELRVKNNALYSAIHRCALSVTAFCQEFGLQRQHIYALLSLRDSPYRANSTRLRPLAIRLIEILGSSTPEVLFPPHLYGDNHPTDLVLEMDSTTFLSLESSAGRRAVAQLVAPPDPEIEADLRTNQIRETLAKLGPSLTKQEEIVLNRRFCGQETPLEAIASELKVSRGRVCQIEEKALRKLRHPSRSHLFKDIQ